MGENVPKVSIVLPTYNGSKYLRQAIESCVRQTYEHIELIVVDDGSTDEAPEIIRSYTDPRITSIRHEKNRGLPRALNAGFSAATGEYLTWTSDDNQYLPNAIEEMVNCLRKNRGVDFVYTDYWARYLDTGKKELRRLPNRLALNLRNEVGPCFLYTRRAYEVIGKYDPKYEFVEDYDYWIRISKQLEMIHYSHPLYVYGEHDRSLKGTKFHSINLFDAFLKYQNRYLSLRELGRSVFGFFHGVLKSPKRSKEKAFLLLSNSLRIWHLSWSLALLSLFLLTGMTVYKSAQRLLKSLFILVEMGRTFFTFSRLCASWVPQEEKRNVLWIIPYMVAGGSESVVSNIVKGIDGKEYSFHLVTTEPARHVWRERFEPYFQNVVVCSKWVAHEETCHRYFCELVRRLHVDIVMISNSRVGYKYVPKLRARFPQVKMVDILHSEEGWGTQSEFIDLAPYFERRICISHHLKEVMIERYKVAGIAEMYFDRLRAIHNGIDLAEYNPENAPRGRFKSRHGIPSDSKIVSFIGRFEEEKNPLLFVDLARKIIERSPTRSVRFVMAGEGPLLKQVNKAIAKNGMKELFHLTGRINNTVELLADSSLLLVVSRTEGIPLVAMEAIATGVPVLSSRVGAMGELIENNVHGFLVDLGENFIERSTKRVLAFFEKEGDLPSLLAKRREAFASEFSLKRMSERYQCLFEEMLASS
jgi:glycosyltransferase involved in cell wall biosynthesis